MLVEAVSGKQSIGVGCISARDLISMPTDQTGYAQVLLQLHHRGDFAGEAIILLSFSPLTKLEKSELLADNESGSDSEDDEVSRMGTQVGPRNAHNEEDLGPMTVGFEDDSISLPGQAPLLLSAPESESFTSAQSTPHKERSSSKKGKGSARPYALEQNESIIRFVNAFDFTIIGVRAQFENKSHF